jgi:hypothetical protein
MKEPDYFLFADHPVTMRRNRKPGVFIAKSKQKPQAGRREDTL